MKFVGYRSTEKLNNRDNWLKNIKIKRSALEEMHFMVVTFYLKNKSHTYVNQKLYEY